MKKAVALIATGTIMAGALAGCGGDSEYCATVKEHVSALDSFGKKKTNAAFTKYRRATNAVAKVAPEDVRKDWSALTKALVEVKDAQKTAGLKLEDTSVEAVAGLSTVQSVGLNEAYQSFTDAVADHGKAVKDSVQEQCGVTLK